MMKRLGVFAAGRFGEEVSDSNSRILHDIQACCSECVTVVGGDDAVRAFTDAFGDKGLIACPEPPVDSLHAYAFAVKALGASKLAEFDEVVFLDDSFFGPIGSFSEVFDAMERRDGVDFWGITEMGETEAPAAEGTPARILPRHVQLYFFAVRQPAVASPAFSAFWTSIDKAPASEDAQALEASFTAELAACGFGYGTYVAMDDLVSGEREGNIDLSIYDSFELVSRRGMPLIRKGTFTVPRHRALEYGTSENARKLLDYLASTGAYDADAITAWALRTLDLAQVHEAFGSFEVVHATPHETPDVPDGCVLVLILKSASSACVLDGIPACVDVHVISDAIDEQALSVHTGRHVLHRPRKGAPQAQFMALCEEEGLPSAYRYIGYAADHESAVREFVSVDSRFGQLSLDAVAASTPYLADVLGLLEKKPSVGVVGLREPDFASYFGDALAWRLGRGGKAGRMADALRKRIPMNIERLVEPVRAFWAKADAVAALLSFVKQAGIEDDDGLRDSFRFMPYIAQATGYLTRYIATPTAIGGEMTRDKYMLRQSSKLLRRLEGVETKTFTGFLGGVSSFTKAGLARLEPGLTEGQRALAALLEQQPELPESVARAYIFLRKPNFNEGMHGPWKTDKRQAAIFAPARTNAISWLPIGDEDVVVDYGADYGEFVPMLANAAKHVYAFDADAMRRDFIAERCMRYGNVSVPVSEEELRAALGSNSPDWLIVHNLEGVFEDKEQLCGFLRSAKEAFGARRIVVLCSNADGVRYTSECRLAELGERVVDVQERDLRLGREELEGALSDAGYGTVAIFYPHPDYLYCKTMFSDESLPSAGSVKASEIWRLKGQRLQPKEERLELVDVVARGEYPQHANTYVAVAADAGDAAVENLPIFVRFPSDRKERYSMRTTITRDGYVRKYCTDPSGYGHVKRAQVNTQALRDSYAKAGLILDPIDYYRDGIKYAFIPGRDLQNVLIDLLSAGDSDGFTRTYKDYLERIARAHDEGYFVASSGFQQVFGSASLGSDLRCAGASCIDINPDNIIVGEDGDYHVIDCEWVFAFPIPAKYIIWRAIYFFFSRLEDVPDAGKLADEAYGWMGIDDEMKDTFRKMERSFQKYMGL